ncbi:monovalent cation/H(+) antiporter subunit G [Nocardiopsis nanhaiensis]
MNLDDIGGAVMLLGSLVFLVGALGVIRMPDVYTRLNALTISGALGTGLVLVGLFLHYPSWENAIKVGLAVFIQLATTAVGGSAMARAGYLIGSPRTASTRFDDLEVEENDTLTDEQHPGYSRPSPENPG